MSTGWSEYLWYLKYWGQLSCDDHFLRKLKTNCALITLGNNGNCVNYPVILSARYMSTRIVSALFTLVVHTI